MVRPGYKRTEVGEIPKDWDVKSLRDLVKKRMLPSGLYKHKSLYGRGTKLIKLGDVFRLDIFKPELAQRALLTESEKKSYKVNVGDIFIALASVKLEGVGKVMLVRELDEITAFDHNVALIRTHGTVDSNFLSYLMKSGGVRTVVGKNATQVGTSFLKASTILGFQLPIPNNEEQKAIAKALSDLDELIASLEKLIAKKRDIKTATMQQLLTGKKRLSGFGEGKGYIQTEFGEIPEDWDVKTYGEVFSFYTTASNSRDDLNENGLISYVHYGDIHTKWDINLDISKHNLPKIDRDKFKGAAFIKDGDILMADASEDYEGIGKSIEVNGLGEGKAISGLHTFLLRDNGCTYADGFRGYLHMIPAVKKSFDRLATGLKVYGLSKNRLKTVFIPVPPKKEQGKIVEVFVSMTEEISFLSKRLSKTKSIKQGMMQELLTGRTRLI